MAQTTFALSAGWSIRPSTSKNPQAMQLQTISRILERSLRTLWASATLTGFALGVLLVMVLPLSGPAHAQNPAKPGAEAAPQAVPGFWDPRRRPDRPDLSRLTVIRFLTETDYPPFNFTGPDGN